MSLDCSEESQSSTGSGRRYISPVDQYLMTLNPDHKPASEEALIKTVLRGKHRSHLEEAWTRHVAQANRIVAKFKAKPHKADKPKEGEASVMYYDIPDSESLAIRRWDSNMQEYGLYCFDLYDTSKRIAINLPDNYKICNVPHTGAFVIGGSGSEVKSWEMTWGILREDTLPGQERFAVPEGSHLVLFRPDKQPFFFALPTRPRVYRGVAAIFAQPRH